MSEVITETKPKNKGGRPKKEKNGKHFWIPSEYVDIVKAILETGKTQKQQKQINS